MMPVVSTGRGMPIGLSDFVVPANLFLNSVEQASEMELPKVRVLYQDKRLKEYFDKYGRFPFSYGLLVETVPMREQHNDLFELGPSLFTWDIPLFSPRKSKFKAVISTDTFTDLSASLKSFEDRYWTALLEFKS